MSAAYRKDSFMFEIETNGQMEPEDVVLSALQIVDQKCNTILETDGGGGGMGMDDDDDYVQFS